MYKTPELIKKIKLSEIPVPNQEKIQAETGSPLDLQQAFDIIKEVSQDFQLYDERAVEADKLLSSLIEKELKKSKKEKAKPEVAESPAEDAELLLKQKAAAARKRKLQLLKVKMELKKESKK